MFDNDVLSAEAMKHFEEQGVIRIREAFRYKDALAMQDFTWSQLQKRHGVDRNDRSTWSITHYELNHTATDAIYDAIAAPRLCGAIDQLLGQNAWDIPKSWGGFLITFPEGAPDAWTLKGKMWHWDGNPNDHLSYLRGLFIFSLYSHIQPRGGGTLLVAGSHRLINRHFSELPPQINRNKQAPIRREFVNKHNWFEELIDGDSNAAGREMRYMAEDTMVAGVPLRVVEITGEPGDVYICHPSIFHSASFNHATMPRFMRAKGLTVRIRS